MKSSARRRFTVSMLGILAIGILPALASPSGVHVVTVPAASGPWLDRFNAWRASTGLSTLGENATYSAGDASHALYMVQTQQVTHSESTAYPQYTAAGDTAARNSNIYVSSSTGTTDVQAIDFWMQAPFHALGMMDPRLTTTGFGSYRSGGYGTWQMGAAVNVSQGNSFAGGTYPVYFPGKGSTEPLTTYGGGEFPDPLQGPCAGYTAPTGLPVFVQVGGNVATSAGPVHTIVGNGISLENCVLDSSSPNVGSNLTWRGGVVLIPRQPLQIGVTYTVALTVNSLPYTWSFTVGGPSSTPTPSGSTFTMPYKGLYTLDSYGGITPDSSVPVTVSSYWPGWKIVRAAKTLPGANAPKSGFVLDAFGGLHPYGSPVVTETSGSGGHYWGWDIARDFVFMPDGTGGFVLDGFGGLHAFKVNGSTTPLSAQGFSYWGWDIARKVVIFPDGTGGYTLDGWGGIHPFGINGAPPVSTIASNTYWPRWDIAHDIVLVPGNGNHSGYVLDGYGGLHPFHPTTDGSAAPAAISSSYFGWDITRSVWFLPTSATAGYTLDGYGGLHPFGGAPAVTSSTYWGFDMARELFGA